MNKPISAVAVLGMLLSPLLMAATVKGYVSNGPTVPVSGAEVRLLDVNGNVVAQDTTGWTGGYKLKNIEPGAYVLQTGSFALAVQVEDGTLRQDFDQTRPGGAFSYGELAVEQAIELLQKQATQASAGSGPGSASSSSSGSSINLDSGSNVCYSGTCEDTSYGTTINYGADGSMTEY